MILLEKRDAMEKKGARKEYLLVIIIDVLYVLGTTLISGTFFSGYHLVDDHAVIRRMYMYEHNEMTFYQKCISGFPWLGQRFRPLYTFLYRTRIVLFKDNWKLWYLVVAAEIVVIIFLAYCIARMLKCCPVLSFLFSVLIVTGQQSAIWWRLGPQEPIGLLFLMLCMFLLLKSTVCNKRIYLYLAFISAFLSSACKESFVLVLPLLPFLALAFELLLNEVEYLSKAKALEVIKKYLVFFISIGLLFIAEIYVIINKVGILSIGYAGIDTQLGVSGYIDKIIQILKYNMLPYMIVLPVLAGEVIICSAKKKQSKSMMFHNAFLLGIMLMVVGMQLILYAKSGMWERYLVPSSVALAFILVIVVNNVTDGSRLMRFIHIGVIIVLCSYLYCFKTFPSALQYAENGKEIQDLFQTVLTEIPKDAVIVVSLEDEANLAVESYLELKLGYPNVFSLTKEGQIEDKASTEMSIDMIDNVGRADYIIGNQDDLKEYKLVKEWGFSKLWKRSA